MAAQTDRQKLKICQFGEKCYRKNPIHFGEFAHPHLDKIFHEGPDPVTKKYNLPDGLDAETTQQQLKLLEKIFPKENQSNVTASSSANKVNEQTSGRNSPTNKAIINKRSYASLDSEPNTSTAEQRNHSKLAKKQEMSKDINQYIPVVVEKGKMAKKLQQAAPYNMFLTAITDSKLTHNERLSVTLQEILDESLGEIECSVQINFMVDIGWLLGHYYFAGILGTPLLVLYGDETPELKTISQHQHNVTAINVKMPTPFSTSHTKMMLLGYKDGSTRVVISTANLYEDDWHNRTQGVWISPLLSALSKTGDDSYGESSTNFRHDLMLYLAEYKIAQLQPWIARIRCCDFRDVNVFFIGSVPGGFQERKDGYPWGHARLGNLLNRHAPKIDEKVPIICQSSSIGSLGSTINKWIHHDFLNSLRRDSKPLSLRGIPPFKMIYPSFGNVTNSHDGLLGGGCLPYGKQTNDKQPWLKNYLHQWTSRDRHRSRAMPHIKSYTRLNMEKQCVYWFVLTSANLSRAAWGSLNTNANVQPSLRISNYEAGVLFLPKFVSGEDTFPLGCSRGIVPPFPLPYDVPLTPYGPDDTPFLMDYLQ